MRFVFGHGVVGRKSHPGLVNHGRGLQSVTGPFIGHVVSGDPSQFPIYGGQELVAQVLFATLVALEKVGEIFREGMVHARFGSTSFGPVQLPLQLSWKLGHGPGVRISEILQLHRAHAPEQSHPDILGDPYLMNANPIYRRTKVQAILIGCEYVEAYPQYLLMPFHELNKIVESKRVPYVPNGRLLREIEDRRPNVFSVDEVRLPESYHLHESAHVIAEHCFSGVVLLKPEEKILKTLLCESFANTVDAWACVPATDEIHRFFLEHNCYMKPNKKNMDVMARLEKAMGFRAAFMLTLFAYLHANFLQESLSDDVIRSLFEQYSKAEVTDKILRDARALGAIGEKLDPQFRVQTTGAYLKMEGYTGEVFELLNFPFMRVFAAQPGFRRATEAMAEVFA